MICPNCGEDNSSNFRFCGMCGTALEPKRPVGVPRVTSAQETTRMVHNAPAESRTPAATQTKQSLPDEDERVLPTAGPSFLGLNQSIRGEPKGNDRSPLQDQSFSGMSSFYEPEEGNSGAGRIVLLVVLLALLGGAGYWAYSNYDKLGAATKQNPQTATTKPEASEPENTSPSPKSSTATTSSPDAGTSQAATPPAQSTNSSSAPAVEPKADEAQSDQTAGQKTEQNAAAPAKTAGTERPSRSKKVARSERASTRRPAERPSPAAATNDKGDAEFRKGEAFLYGKGAAKNCDQAIRNLKAASAKQNARARSTFGTMYATGHCVPRDLPTSYSWFALALRADPNNQVLEKDLVSVWNQMTPPERQMATRSKQ